MGERHGRARGSHCRNGHALAVRGRRQVQPEFRHSVLDEAHCHRGFACDFVGFVAQRNAENVVLHVDSRLALVSIGEDQGDA